MSASVEPRVTPELPCVWSLAGVLGAHPCDRHYECDGCELYHALSGRRPPGEETPVRGPVLSNVERAVEAEVGRIVSRLTRGCRLELDRWYGPGGIWVVRAEDGALELGLAGCIWRLARPVRAIEFSRTGLSFESGETCGWIVRRDRSFPIRMPVAGRILASNPDVGSAAGSDREVPDAPDVWLLRVDAASEPGESDGLFRGEDALVWFLRQLRVLKGLLREAVESTGLSALGPVLPDGGEPAADLEQILGADRYGALISRLF